MRHTPLMLIAALLSTCLWMSAGGQTPDAQAQPTREPSRWAGYPVGSWVELRMEQKEGDEKEEQTQRKAIKSISESGEPVIATVFVPDRPNHTYADHQEQGGLSLESAGFEKKSSEAAELKVDGKVLACTLETWMLDDPHRGRTTLKLWRCDSVNLPRNQIPIPGRVVVSGPVARLEVEQSSERATSTMTMAVTDLDEEVKVGDATVSCVSVEVSMAQKQGDRAFAGRGYLKLSDKVPGCHVRTYFEAIMGDRVVGMEASQVVGYHVPSQKP